MNTLFSGHDAVTYNRALHAFRRRRQLKRIRSTAQLLAILAIAAYWFGSRQPTKESLFVSAPSPTPAVSTVTPSEPHSLTDDELIAKFPPGSCFMAEVNGRKILVFKDAAVEKQFFQ